MQSLVTRVHQTPIPFLISEPMPKEHTSQAPAFRVPRLDSNSLNIIIRHKSPIPTNTKGSHRSFINTFLGTRTREIFIVERSTSATTIIAGLINVVAIQERPAIAWTSEEDFIRWKAFAEDVVDGRMGRAAAMVWVQLGVVPRYSSCRY